MPVLKNGQPNKSKGSIEIKMNIPKIDFRNPKIRNAGIVILIGLAGVLLLYQMPLKTRQKALKELNEKQKKKQNELNVILAMKPQRNKLVKDLSHDSLRLDSLKSIFPDQKEIPKLIRDVTRVAHASGIHTRKFNPLPDLEKEYYIENRYSLSVIGGYHQLAHFISFLANLPLLVNLSDVSLMANPEMQRTIEEHENHGTPIQTVSVSFTMTTFSSKR
ncbi:MAG: type 4a pilus biogenesis protein PilO [Chitinivibrionales bacterium]|nr:type 4a pilus biogenesis protein PilO [Chitinivibrionales bacterium]